MTNTVDLNVIKQSKKEKQLLGMMDSMKIAKELYNIMKSEGFSDEFIAIYLGTISRG